MCTLQVNYIVMVSFMHIMGRSVACMSHACFTLVGTCVIHAFANDCYSRMMVIFQACCMHAVDMTCMLYACCMHAHEIEALVQIQSVYACTFTSYIIVRHRGQGIYGI